MLKEWFEYLYSQCNKACYVIGAQGHHFKTTEEVYAFIDRQEKNKKDNARAKVLFRKRLMSGIPIAEIRFFDCSGLAMYYFLKEKLAAKDLKARFIYSELCTPIKKEELKPGDCVFHANAIGYIHHCGFNTPKGIVECYGRDRGVGSFNSTWNRYGRLKFFANEINPPTAFYTVKKGDNLTVIARKYSTTVKQLLAWNPNIKNKNYIYTGQKVRIK